MFQKQDFKFIHDLNASVADYLLNKIPDNTRQDILKEMFNKEKLPISYRKRKVRAVIEAVEVKNEYIVEGRKVRILNRRNNGNRSNQIYNQNLQNIPRRNIINLRPIILNPLGR